MQWMRWMFVVCACAAMSVSCRGKLTPNVWGDAETPSTMDPYADIEREEYLVWETFPADPERGIETGHMTSWIANVDGKAHVLARRSGIWIAIDNAQGTSDLWRVTVEPTDEARLLDSDCIYALEKAHRPHSFPDDEDAFVCRTLREPVPRLHILNKQNGEEVVIPSRAEGTRNVPDFPDLFLHWDETIDVYATQGRTLFASRCYDYYYWDSAHENIDCEPLILDIPTGAQQSMDAWLGTWDENEDMTPLREEALEQLQRTIEHGCDDLLPSTSDHLQLAFAWPDWTVANLYTQLRFLADGPYICSGQGWGDYSFATDVRTDKLPPALAEGPTKLPPLLVPYWDGFPDNIARGWSVVRAGTDVRHLFLSR